METNTKSDALNLRDEFCTIEATVPTGFETVAKGEVQEKIGTECKELRGRIKFSCPVESVEQVIKLGCVDNCRVVMMYEPNFKFTDNKAEDMQRLRNLVGTVPWPKGLQIWKRFFSFEHPVAEVPETITTDFGEPCFPPPRQSSGTSKRTRKTKGKKWRKKKDIHENDNENSTEKESLNRSENSGEVNAQRVEENNINKESETDHRTLIADSENKACINSGEGKETEKTVANKGMENEVVDDNNSAKETVENEDNQESQAKKPRVRENPWDPLKPSFRVTCNRNGEGHNFDSMTAAANFGGAIYRYFGWNVKMTEFDIEVILGIEDHEVTVSIGLTKESLHRRNITHFGPTTLRPTVAYSMLRLCEIQKGDVVCDPMCGSGSIPIQSAMGWPESYNICADIASRSVWRTKDNLNDLNTKFKINNKPCINLSPIRWDTCNMPLRDNTVDVFVTDLPFGVRQGHKVDNWRLYPGALLEMARVVKPETGRCCVLTEDRKCIIKTLQKISKYWTRTKTLGVNIGGLAAGVFLLKRTALPFDKGEKRDLFMARGSKGDK